MRLKLLFLISLLFWISCEKSVSIDLQRFLKVQRLIVKAFLCNKHSNICILFLFPSWSTIYQGHLLSALVKARIACVEYAFCRFIHGNLFVDPLFSTREIHCVIILSRNYSYFPHWVTSWMRRLSNSVEVLLAKWQIEWNARTSF